MTSTAIRIREDDEPPRPYRAPFQVLAVGRCSAVKPLLERILNAGPQVELHTCVPDGAGSCALHGHVPDLIFVDADSSHDPAARLCRYFRHNIETHSVPLIVVSCSAKACEEALEHGADDFATPRTRPALLLRRIEALVQVGQARKILRVEDEGAREPRFPPLRWRGGAESGDPLSRIQFADEPPVCIPAVVLFADLRGYTHLCECLAPGQVVLLLKEYFSLLTQITLEHQGVVFNTAGDCLMAGFGLSHEQSYAADRALRAAQMMLKRFASLAEGWLMRLQVTVGLGVGLNTGEVAIAPTGFPQFTHYTLIGDPVNVAARLCQRARAGEIVLSASFKQALREKGAHFTIAALPQVAVRGRSEPVDVFCLPLERRSAPVEPIPGAALAPGLAQMREPPVTGSTSPVMYEAPAHR
jgi:class 3 adenylate cyclase/CheY-like chemotaxis protein